MPIYEFGQDRISPIDQATFSDLGVHERRDLQRLLRAQVDVIAPGTLVIAEEFGEWDDSRRRIDLLGIDKAANLVVIELKRSEDGGHMELQAIRYAAMVSTMEFDQAVGIFSRHLVHIGKAEVDAREALLEFLSWDEPHEDLFAQDVRIVLASAEFSKELTSSVLWLLDRDVDIRCVRLKPYRFEGRLLVDVQQIIPLPEVEEYQVQVREKAQKERQARAGKADFTRFNVVIDGRVYEEMTKRGAILLLCKTICESGVPPAEIAGLFTWRSDRRTWCSVEGTVDASTFLRLAAEKAEAGGQAFEAKRWCCADDELVHTEGWTHALTSQWGGEHWRQAMTLLKERYPDHGITFSPANESE